MAWCSVKAQGQLYLYFTTHPIYLKLILTLSLHLRLGLTSGLFPSDFWTKILYVFLISAMLATYVSHLIQLDTKC
jgi:hypothetical protein